MMDRASAVLTELRLEGTLCDVVIRVGDTEFNAHKVILCSCSLYFRTLFTGAWANSRMQITIPGVSPEMMHLIINYAYNHSVPVTEDNVVEVLAAADQFLVPGMVQTCCFFLEDRLCCRNCIGIWRLVDFYHCPELRHKVFVYILYHFEEIACVSHESLELSVQQLATIIEHDHLNVKRETTVFEFVLRWIEHRPDQRRGHISVLLPKVRLGLMNICYFKTSVIDNAVIKNSVECVPIINDAVTAFIDLRDNRQSKSVYRNLLTRPRLPSAILLAIGGKDDTIAATSLEAYDPHTDWWITVSTEKIMRAHHGAAVLNNFVYLIGGCIHETYLNTVQKFDLVTCTWHQVAPMNSRRCFVSVAVQNGCIYAMGGYNGHIYLNTVECYKPETDQWTMKAPMRARRSGAGSTTVNGKVYICGGFNGLHNIATAECYNPNTNRWTMIASMSRRRSGLGVTVYRDLIFAVGGIADLTRPLRSVEAYNCWTNTWNPVSPMCSYRSDFGIEVVNDQLFVVGGYYCSTAVSTVERYDVEGGGWYSAADIETPRSGLKCCVLHGLYGAAENLFPRGPLKVPNEAAGGSI